LSVTVLRQSISIFVLLCFFLLFCFLILLVRVRLIMLASVMLNWHIVSYRIVLPTALAGKVMQSVVSVCTSVSFHSNQLAVDLDICICVGHRSSVSESEGHRSRPIRFGLAVATGRIADPVHDVHVSPNNHLLRLSYSLSVRLSVCLSLCTAYCIKGARISLFNTRILSMSFS